MDSIAKFATELMQEQVAQGNPATPVTSNVDAPDISHVEVPDSFMDQILGEETAPKPKEEKAEVEVQEQEQEEKPASTPLTEETAQRLIESLDKLTNQLNEMTTTGSIGVNLAGPTHDQEVDRANRERGYETPKSRKETLKGKFRERLKARS